MERRHPGIGWQYEGEQREQRETLEGLFRGFVVAMVIIYALMAIILLFKPAGLVPAGSAH